MICVYLGKYSIRAKNLSAALTPYCNNNNNKKRKVRSQIGWKIKNIRFWSDAITICWIEKSILRINKNHANFESNRTKLW